MSASGPSGPLVYLFSCRFVSDNQLPSFPHPVMEKEGSSYPKLERM